MKILSCYVENFGRLNKFTYYFEDGLNVIEEDNGWGKSTLAAFIKAMFYGLEHHRGKKLTDRKLYKPWNGNKFGGYLIFERDGIEYKIERFFGRTPKYDTLTVYNSSRNTVTDELGDNPGEAIWGVDRDSYEKTAFISLDDSNLLNDIISSKLGEIEDGEADLETSTKAVEILDQEITRIKARRGKGGLIGIKESKLSKLKEELRSYKNSLEKINQTEEWIEKEEKELEKIDRELNKIEEEQSKLVLYEKKDQYINIKKDLQDKEKEYDKNKEFFKEKTLTEGELNFIKYEAGKYSNHLEQAREEKLSDEEDRELEELKNKFKINMPDADEIDDYNNRIKELSNKKIELEKYKLSSEDKSKFDFLDKKYKDIKIDSATIDGYLDDLNRVSELSQEENRVKNELERLEEEKEKAKTTRPKRVPKFSNGLIILILGIILVALSPIIGSIVGLIGVYEIVVSFIYKGKNKKEDNNEDIYIEIEKLEKQLKDIEDEKQELSVEYNSFINSMYENPSNIGSFLANSKFELMEYNRLKNYIENNIIKKNRLEDGIFNLKLEIENYLNRYYSLPEESNYSKLLSDLRNNLYRFQDLSRVEESYKQRIKLVESSREILKEKLQYYFQEFPRNLTSSLEELTKKYYALQTSKNRLEEAKINKEKFESENDISRFKELDILEEGNNKISDSLIKKKKDLNDSKSELIKIIERHKKDIYILVQEADRIEDIESEITQLEIDIKELEDQHNLLEITKEAMFEAKENLAEKYMGHMSSNFKKYLEKLNNKKTEQYHLDINLDVKVEHGGELYKGEQLSSGMKDLVQLCLRMALVESVYKDVDNPILILDDPFINLDDDRLENAINLLKEVSLDYQIIYFICHSSRNLQGIS